MDPDDPSEDAICSTTGAVATGIDDVMQMPTTAQLMEVIKHINPFDQKFREANEAMKAGDFSQVLNSLATTSVCNDSSLRVDSIATSSNSDEAATLRLINSDLRLKLPDAVATSTMTLGDVCTVLNSDDSGGGCGLDTPDIANLVTQIKEDGLSAKTPLTADVLKTVLEIRETIDEQRQRKKLSKEQSADQQQQLVEDVTTKASVPYDDPVLQKASVGVPSNSYYAGQQREIEQCDSLLGTDIDANRLSSSPPALQNHECVIPTVAGGTSSISVHRQENDQLRYFGHGAGAIASTTFEQQQTRTLDDVVIALKIGDQDVRIPVKINVSACDPSEPPMPPLVAAPTPVRRKLTGELPSVRKMQRPFYAGIPVIAASSQASSSGQQVIFPTSTPQNPTTLFDSSYSLKQDGSLIGNAVCVMPTADAGEDETRKREVMERNKQAACRYRKRKKEEMSSIQDKLRKTETEKLELSTQVQVLRMELERLRNILDSHKDCSVTKEQRKKKKAEPVSFEYHTPLFHSLVPSSLNFGGDSRSNTPQDDAQIALVDSNGSSSGKIANPTSSKAKSVVSNRPRSSSATSSALFLASPPSVFSTTAATGQLLQYVALPSPAAGGREGGESSSSPQKFILQPVIVPTAQTMILPGASSPVLFPTLLRMNSSNCSVVNDAS